jgi:molybdopterin-guanine dinucleotide biosynthesis protein A
MKNTKRATDLSIAIMAGGKSVRMGTDKAFVPFRGKTMIEHVIERVQGLSEDIFIVTNKPESFEVFGFPTVSDIYQNCGPLGGIHTALHHLLSGHLLIVACDMPWLERDLLDYMISVRAEGDIVVPRWDKFPEPLHAIYSKTCQGPVEDSLDSGVLKVVGFYGKVTVRYVERNEIERFDPHGRSFANLNTPTDIEDAESY